MKGWNGLHEKNGNQVFSCAEDHCYYSVLVTGDDSTRHKCPATGTTTYGWSITVSIVEDIWHELDCAVAKIRAKEDVEQAKCEARAYARVLLLFMKPFFNTVEEISKEAMLRYKAKHEGLEHETPGINHARYKTLMDGEVWYKTKEDGWTSDPRQADGVPSPSELAMRTKASGIIAVALGAAPTVVSNQTAMFSEDELARVAEWRSKGFPEELIAKYLSVDITKLPKK